MSRTDPSLLQAAHDHATTASEMLERVLNDHGLDAHGLAARIHLTEALASLSWSLRARQQDLNDDH